ncbi:hypothetical protein ACFLRC_02610 [Candidatus Altiarchaeota archaeon]
MAKRYVDAASTPIFVSDQTTFVKRYVKTTVKLLATMFIHCRPEKPNKRYAGMLTREYPKKPYGTTLPSFFSGTKNHRGTARGEAVALNPGRK